MATPRWRIATYLDASAAMTRRRCSTRARAAGSDARGRRAVPGGRRPTSSWHIGEVHDFWGDVVAERLDDCPTYDQPQRPESVDPPTTSACSPSPRRREQPRARRRWPTPIRRRRCGRGRTQHDVGFVARRMAHETAVHRVDAERAAGRDVRRSTPSWRPTAIDEFLEFFLPDVADDAPPLAGHRAPALHRRRRRVARRRRRRLAATSSRASTPRATPPSAARPTTCCWCCGGAAARRRRRHRRPRRRRAPRRPRTRTG